MALQLSAPAFAPIATSGRDESDCGQTGSRTKVGFRRGGSLVLALIASVLLLNTSTSAQSVVLTEAFADPAGRLHFAVTKVLHVEGSWIRHPLEVGTIIEPPSTRRAHPLRRFGETVLFVLPQRDNLRAYWSYNVHDGFVPAVEGRPLSQVISLLVPPVEAQPAPVVIAAVPQRRRLRERDREFDQDEPREKSTASHELMAEALRELSSAAGPANLNGSPRRLPELQK